jgi:hypothetical protein
MAEIKYVRPRDVHSFTENCVATCDGYVSVADYMAAIRTLQEIAAMGRKAGSEAARHRLAQLGEPLEPGGYVTPEES